MSLATLVALTLFLLPLQLSPGPANLYFASLAGRFGLRLAVWPLLGYLAGAFALTLLVGLGLNTAVFGRPEVMRPMQLAGAAYMLWLAWSFLRSDYIPSNPAPSDPAQTQISQPPTSQTGVSQAEEGRSLPGIVSGALVLLLNPKAYLIVALTLAQFARGTQTPVYVVLVALVIVLTYMLAFALWAGASAGAGRWLQARQLRLVYAASIALAVLWTGWEALR